MGFEHQSRQIVQTTPLEIGIQEFLLHQRVSNHSQSTLEWYDYNLNKFRTWLQAQGVNDVCEITTRHIREYMVTLEQRMAAISVHNQIRSIRTWVRFLHVEEFIPTDPSVRVKLPKLDNVILPPFTDEDVKKLEAITAGKDPISVRNRALIYLLLDSGLRLAECSNLRIGDINFESGQIKVMGKGRKERWTRVGATTLRALNRYLRLRGGEHHHLLWIGRRGLMTKLGVAETIEKLGKACGVHAHPHRFRRTCAIRMIRAGADLFSVQQLLGHADLEVLRRYAAINKDDVMRAHERFGPIDSLR